MAINKLAAAAQNDDAAPAVDYPKAPPTHARVQGPSPYTSIRVDKTVTAELSTLADERGVSVTKLVDAVLVEWLERQDKSAPTRIQQARGRGSVRL